MARWSFVNGFVRLSDATQSSGSAGTVTADTVTAARSAVPKPGAGSAAALTPDTSKVRKASSIIGTGSANTAVVVPV
jgi:hypothetical protein